ncbi:MAG: sugar phosphate nucleotidyltransferase [Verrucomicrobia bacterium]|nr:sugar phosphate nucleotidyltransferase [Verrucomicrobiota bacterium]
MSQERFAVIMAGGKGERFWPLSTTRSPKQVLKLFGAKSLLDMAIERLDGLVPTENVFIVTSAELVEATIKGAPQLPPGNIIGEPVGRDTAAAIGLGAALVKSRNPSAAFCVVTADHLIGDLDVFRSTLRESMDLALAQDVLITMGISPSYAATGFGYIESGQAIPPCGDVAFFKVNGFVEKPDQKTAETYVSAGTYYWNSGMFVWSVKAILKALAKYHVPVFQMAESMLSVVGKSTFADTLAMQYATLDKISVDYAIMEKADNIIMAKGTFRWDDAGSWPALANHFPADSDQNVVLGRCQQIDAKRNIIVSQNRLTALIGVDDLVVVQSEGVTLVCAKDRAQDVKAMVKVLQDQGDSAGLL